MGIYAQQHFGKPLHLISYSDVEEYFRSEQDETHTLEFKAGDTEIDRLCEEITAFLNTDGGLLIYGSPKPKGRESRPQKGLTGQLTTVVKCKTEEQLTQQIAKRIMPMPVGLDVKLITMDEAEGRIFLIEVPKSPYAPHQLAEKGTYYVRISSVSSPAPHGIVEALFQKRQRPFLECNLLKPLLGYTSITYDMELSNSRYNTASQVGFSVKVLSKEGVVNSLMDSNPQKTEKRKIAPGLIELSFNIPLIQTIIVHNQSYTHPISIFFKNLGHIMMSIGYYCHDGEYLTKIFFINLRNPSALINSFIREGGQRGHNADIIQKINHYKEFMAKETLTAPPIPPSFS